MDNAIKTPADKLRETADLLGSLTEHVGRDAAPFVVAAVQMLDAAIDRCEKPYKGQAEMLLEILGDLEMVDGLPVPLAGKVARAVAEVNDVVIDLTGNQRLKDKRKPYREQAAQVARAVAGLQFIEGLPVNFLAQIEFATELLGDLATELGDADEARV